MKWDKFLKEFGNLLFFWFFGILFFSIFRFVFITIYAERIKVWEGMDLLRVLRIGFQFDTTVMGYFTLIPLLVLFISVLLGSLKVAVIIRKVHQGIFILLSTIICVITINYFREYNDQFNHFLFMILYDDQKAVAKTILKDFHPILNIIVSISVMLISFWILHLSEKGTLIYSQLRRIHFKGSKFIFILVLLGLFFIGIRGSYTDSPITKRDAFISKDAFLNKTTLNPYRALDYALEDFQQVNSITKGNPFLSEQEEQNIPYNTVTEVLKKQAKGTFLVEKPKQIFLIVMESYDSWPLMKKYEGFGVATHLTQIAQAGMRFTHFLPASFSTFNSFGAITAGVPFFGYSISNISTTQPTFATSIFQQFKKLGYQVNFFYGGYLAWENLGVFCEHQGVEHIWSAANVEQRNNLGFWGIEDEKLFHMVQQNVPADTYSLNVILTTSYHSPYDVDIYDKGFPYHSEADLPASVRKYWDGKSMNLKELGHLWYGDKCIGDFVKVAEQKYPNAVFAFTGDHFGRRFVNAHPNLYERSSVNFILYGKGIKAQELHTPGTHIDIMPTLIEMVAPKGFEYYSFGESLFSEGKNTAISFEKMIQGDELFYIPKNGKPLSINLNTMEEHSVADPTPYEQMYNQQMGLAWWYTVKGNQIKE